MFPFSDLEFIINNYFILLLHTVKVEYCLLPKIKRCSNTVNISTVCNFLDQKTVSMFRVIQDLTLKIIQKITSYI